MFLKKRIILLVFLLFIIIDTSSELDISLASIDHTYQSGSSFIEIKYGEIETINFSTYYTRTKVRFEVEVGNPTSNSKVNFTVYDLYNFNLFSDGKNASYYLKVNNAIYDDSYSTKLGNSGKYCVLFENNISMQENLPVAFSVIFNDNPYFNPGTIPIIVLLSIILISIGIIGIIFYKKIR